MLRPGEQQKGEKKPKDAFIFYGDEPGALTGMLYRT